MTDCPPRLCGDLSKWLCEINTGVYVGHVSSRVRDALWDRVCQNLKNGRATMVYTMNTEQRMDFRVHNTTWVPVDYDGIKLMKRPLPGAMTSAETPLQPGFSKAAKYQMAQRQKSRKNNASNTYVIIDLETTGLQATSDEILEFGAIRVTDDKVVEEFSRLVRIEKKLPETIAKLTHISEELVVEKGIPLQEALEAFLAFIGTDFLMGYNISFDMNFLRAACKKWNIQVPTNRCMDLCSRVRREVDDVANYKLSTVAEYFHVTQDEAHRALNDCRMVFEIYQKLNEM